MQSMQEHWKGLTLFVEHSDVPMDNNEAERKLRAMVLARNNYWGNHSLWACHLSTAMFSIIQTCLMHKVSPRAYLVFYFNECLKRGAAPPDNDLNLLLPHNLDQQTKAILQTY